MRDYKGAIQTDGYKVYDYFENIPGIVNLACMAHVRRKFVDAHTLNNLRPDMDETELIQLLPYNFKAD